MKKIVIILYLFLILSFLKLLFILPLNVFAQEPLLVGDGIYAIQEPPTLYKNTPSVTFTFTSDNRFIVNQDYTLSTEWYGNLTADRFAKSENPSVLKFKIGLDFESSKTNLLQRPGIWNYKLWLGKRPVLSTQPTVIAEKQYYIYPCNNNNNSGCPSLDLEGDTFGPYASIDVHIVNAQENSKYAIWFEGGKKTVYDVEAKDINPNFPVDNKTFPAAKIQINTGPPSDSKTLCLTQNISALFGVKKIIGGCDFRIPNIKIAKFPVPTSSVSPTHFQSNIPGIPTPGEFEFPTQAPQPTPSLPPCAEWANLEGTPVPTPQAEYIKKNKIKTENLKCIAVDTAIGPINTDPFEFVKSILSKLLSLAGGIAVILIIISGYRLMTSQGNPEAVQAARDQLTSAIVGFLFIIFSLVILQVIGVDILRIPGFTK